MHTSVLRKKIIIIDDNFLPLSYVSKIELLFHGLVFSGSIKYSHYCLIKETVWLENKIKTKNLFVVIKPGGAYFNSKCPSHLFIKKERISSNLPQLWNPKYWSNDDAAKKICRILEQNLQPGLLSNQSDLILVMKCVICYRVTHILCPISSGYLYQMNGQELGDALYTIPEKKVGILAIGCRASFWG